MVSTAEVLRTLKAVNGNKSEAARRLGIYRGTVARIVYEANEQSPVVTSDELASPSSPDLPDLNAVPSVPADTLLPQDSVQADRERRRLRERLTTAEAKYESLLKEIEQADKRLDLALAISDAPPRSVVIEQTEPEQSEAAAIWQASDWHVGERVEPETCNYLNKFNPDIAEQRIKRFFQNGLKLVRKERREVPIKKLLLWLGGDLITGYIHEELQESNSMSPSEEVLFLDGLLRAGLKFLVEDGEFEQIAVLCNYGNHGRTSQKIRVSTGHKNSYEWLMYRNLARSYEGHPVVKFEVANGYFLYADVFGYTLRFSHGDAVKYQGGIGGVTIPLIRAIGRWNTQRRAYMDSIGHFHQRTPYAPWTGFQCNGSLIGFGPYSQRIGASPEAPMQNFQLLDSKRGATISAPILVGE